MNKTNITETDITALVPDDLNFNKGTQYGEHLMDESLRQFGLGRSILIDKNNRIIAGNKTHEKAGELGFDRVLVVETDGQTLVAVKRTDVDLDTEKGRALALADNATGKANLSWDTEALERAAEEFGIAPTDWGVDLDELARGFAQTTEEDGESPAMIGRGNEGVLQERFLIPPFSVLDSYKGYWLKRKEFWRRYDLVSSGGRKEDLVFCKVDETRYRTAKSFNKVSTSAFDPVLCEIAYRWFCFEGGRVLDPFAGGAVRGIVASALSLEYHGNDLRAEQVETNRATAERVLSPEMPRPVWTVGDSLKIDEIVDGGDAQGFDLLFSCPPYADLEKYSDLDEDLSNMDYDAFLSAYREIIRKSCRMLGDDRFAVFVVGEVRDKRGAYRNFVGHTIQAFLDAGLCLYNEMILVTQVGSGSIRAGNIMNASRKVTKKHQNVLVFYKGDIKRIKDNYKPLDLSFLQDEEETEDDGQGTVETNDEE